MSKMSTESTVMLDKWRGIYRRERDKWSKTIEQVMMLDKYYSGNYSLEPLTDNDRQAEDGAPRQARQIWRLCAELIESTVDVTVPQPKVTAADERDEELAGIIEDMLRDELDRNPTEELLDLMARLVPTDGGAPWLVEWDSSANGGRGGISLEGLHAREIVPQDGVYGSVEDMDYIFLHIPMTRRACESRYGVGLPEAGESAPEVKGTGGTEGAETTSDNLVTVIKCYYRNDADGVGVVTWVNDTLLENYPDYWARQERLEGDRPGEAVNTALEYEEVTEPLKTRSGVIVPPLAGVDAFGMPIFGALRIPYYRPECFPIVIQRNITKYGKLLGESEVEKIIDQQNIMSRMMMKIQDKLISGGTMVVAPPNTDFEKSSDDVRMVVTANPNDAQHVRAIDMGFNISQDLAFMQHMYTGAKNVTGVTDSYLGRPDSTAQSGRAKEAQAMQTAGRLESRRVMARAAWGRIFEIMFKLCLAYTDEPVDVRNRAAGADEHFRRFNRFDFLEEDGAGGYRWNDRFLFSVDTDSAPANNRQMLWNNTNAAFQSGAFGNPAEPETWVQYWTHMQFLHYPNADRMLKMAKERLERMQTMQTQQVQQQMSPTGANPEQIQQTDPMLPPAGANPMQAQQDQMIPMM